jgi:dihydrodipicolinate synthase/N-acetylneuraminate lyase
MTWTGVFPAVTTQFKQDGTLHLDATQACVQRLIDGGVSGLVMMGMVGENSSLRPVFHLDTKTKLVQYIKLAGQLKGHGGEWVRAPRLPLSGDERTMVERIVASTDAGLAALST